MFFPEANVRVWLCTQPTDMRRSFNGLSAMVKSTLNDNPLSGHLYVFVNRKKNMIKVLFFDRNGYAIWSKRLEQGQFVFTASQEHKRKLSFAQLQCLIEGIDISKARQYTRFSLSGS